MPKKQIINEGALTNAIRHGVPHIMAETATEFFKHSFKIKSWNGAAWPPVKKTVRRGSLMVRSGKLVNSIKPTEVTSERVVITAGSSKVPYAKVHNEGFNGIVDIPAYQRKMKGKITTVKAHTRRMNMPKRQFMGSSKKMDDQITKRIETYLKPYLNR